MDAATHTPTTTASIKPGILMIRADYDRLVLLAEAIAKKEPELSEFLFGELDRARVVPETAPPPPFIRLGSRFRYTAGGESRTATLVLPAEADIAQGRISVLTPIGAALIGLSVGQSIDWTTRDGRTQNLTVETIDAGPAAGPDIAKAS